MTDLPEPGATVAFYAQVLEAHLVTNELTVELFSKTDQYRARITADLLVTEQQVAAEDVDLTRWDAYDTDGVRFIEKWLNSDGTRVRFERADGTAATYPPLVQVRCVRKGMPA